MSVLDGLHGEITITAGGGETAKIISDATVWKWRGHFMRHMVDVTPKNQSTLIFLPGHGTSFIYVWAYIDQDTGVAANGPGAFNTLEASLILQPNGADAAKKITLTGWVEDFDWISAIDGPNEFRARIRGNSEPSYAWA